MSDNSVTTIGAKGAKLPEAAQAAFHKARVTQALDAMCRAIDAAAEDGFEVQFNIATHPETHKATYAMRVSKHY